MIISNTISNELTDLLDKPVEYQRFVFFQDKIKNNYCPRRIVYVEKDGVFHYSDTMYEVKFGQKLYLKSKSVKGFTFDPKKGKIRVWFNGSILNFNLTDLFRHLKLEWVINERIDKFITKTLLEKILSGKITNPHEACIQIIKSNRLKCSPELLRKKIKEGWEKSYILLGAYLSKDLNHFLQRDKADNHGTSYYIFQDLFKQAKALNRKIDFNWSPNRIKEVHEEWTKELMEIELSFMEDKKIEYNISMKLPSEFELLDTQKRIFQEGKIMRHCVYTNYLNSILNKEYMVYHVDYKGEPVTVGLSVNRKNEVKIHQMFSVGNKAPSLEAELFIKSQLDETFLFALQESFKNELIENL